VLGVGRRVSAEPLPRQLHWLPIQKRIQFKSALLTYKTLLSAQPVYLSSLLLSYNPFRNLHSSSSHFLSVPKVSSSLESRAFSISAPHLWNSLSHVLESLYGHCSTCPASHYFKSFTQPFNFQADA